MRSLPRDSERSPIGRQMARKACLSSSTGCIWPSQAAHTVRSEIGSTSAASLPSVSGEPWNKVSALTFSGILLVRDRQWVAPEAV